MTHEHTWYQDGTSDGSGRVIGTRLVCDCGATIDPYEQQRTRELQPLADALSIMVRGIRDVSVQDTGGGVYCAVGTIGAWQVAGDDYGWSLTNSDGHAVADGGWQRDYGAPLMIDPDTGTLDRDECEAAAVTFASALTALVGRGA